MTLSEERFVELARLLREPDAPVSDSTRADAMSVHISDSLGGLEFGELTRASNAADIGSGAGLPGLPLAVSLPAVEWTLIEATGRKCAFIERAVGELDLGNVTVAAERTEDFSAASPGREGFDVVTARAVGSLVTTAELASPLVRDGGFVMVWRGSRDPAAERHLDQAAGRLALESVEVRPVSPYPGSRDRHIHLLRKNGPTPGDLPRRPGMAAKRPFGVE